MQEEVQKARQDCQKEMNVTDDLIEKAENGNFTDDNDFKCFTKCFYTKLGYLNEKGEPQLELIKENIPENEQEKGNGAIEKCKEKTSVEDLCEKAFALHKCYFEEMAPKPEN